MCSGVKCRPEQFLRGASFVGGRAYTVGRAWRRDSPGGMHVDQAADVWLTVHRERVINSSERFVCHVHVAQKHTDESAPYAARA